MQIDFKQFIPDLELSARCRAAFANAEEEERSAIIAEIAMESIDELAYQPEPTMPYLLKEFYLDKQSSRWSDMTKEEKGDATKAVNRDDNVKEYLDNKLVTISNNLSNVVALERYISIWLDWEEADYGTKCWKVYAKYPIIMEVNNKVIWRRKENFVGA